jgi:hypothetical protein
MSSIPLPALDLKQPQQPDLLEKYGQLMQLRSALQQSQQQQAEAPLRVQALQQQVQSGQQDLQARQALNQAYQGAVTTDANGKPTFDSDKLIEGLRNGPAAYQTPAVMENILKFQKTNVDLQSAKTELQGKQNDLIGSAAAAVKAAGYDPTLAHSLFDSLPQTPQLQQLRSQIDNPQALKQLVDSAIQNSPSQQKMQNEQKVAQIRANTPEAQEMNSWIQANTKPGQPAPTPADYQQFKVNQGVQADVQKQTDPRVQQGKIQVAAAEGQARANIEAQIARGSDAALAQVPPHLVAPATAAATKAGTDYAQAQSVSQSIAEMMDAAKKGNVVSYQLLPQEGALQITTSQGVHRINMAEIQNYGGGSLIQNLQGHLGKALTGQSIPPSVLNDMQQMQDVMQRGSQAKYENDLRAINQNYGAKFQPVTMQSTAPNANAPKVGTVKTFPNGAKGVWDGKGYVAQ